MSFIPGFYSNFKFKEMSSLKLFFLAFFFFQLNALQISQKCSAGSFFDTTKYSCQPCPDSNQEVLVSNPNECVCKAPMRITDDF